MVGCSEWGRPMRTWNCDQDMDIDPDDSVFESSASLHFSEDPQLLVTSGALPAMARPDEDHLVVDLDRDGVMDRVTNQGSSLSIISGRTGVLVYVEARGMFLHLVGVVDLYGDGLLKVIFREGSRYRATDVNGQDLDLGFGYLL